MSHTFSMKTAISIPTPTFQAAERYAAQNKLSRSELYSKALKEYLERHEPLGITDQINAICEEIDTVPDSFFQHLSTRVLLPCTLG
jgi:metal-responsive CopG/Arc/MetJ family transcriptional regulator